jgi:hypothetical protein
VAAPEEEAVFALIRVEKEANDLAWAVDPRPVGFDRTGKI